MILDKSPVNGRDDAGIMTINLIADKYITDAGLKALEKSGFSGMDNIFSEGNNNLIKVLDLELVVALPGESAFI